TAGVAGGMAVHRLPAQRSRRRLADSGSEHPFPLHAAPAVRAALGDRLVNPRGPWDHSQKPGHSENPGFFALSTALSAEEDAAMPFTLPPLPYPADALE